ncbi:MAG: metallophosphoesterase [Candidatus Peregrinibacteria bacterium GW2011_GWC2_33_13]|nr:MAG: metallophosphoesterase [Candidatus Peregrinibacteria bacterium GW2011_GWC2_33_13]
MKLRIISDIHTDINKEKNYQFEFGDDFIVVCGDISGDRFATEDWIKANIKNGVFVEGNHLGYNQITFDSGDTKEHSIKYLKNKFKKGNVLFLENSIHIVENIVFIGCTLYTDFSLYDNPVYCSRMAWKSMNDFRYVNVKDKDRVRTLYVSDTVKWHKKSVNFINKTCKAYPDKKIVVVSHHAPSINCISEEYKADMLSAAFASNLEWIMKENDNLVLWSHGHVHSDVDFTKYRTRVVCCPWGYFNENKRDISNYGLIIDTDTL